MVKSQSILRCIFWKFFAVGLSALLSACSLNNGQNAQIDTHIIKDKKKFLLQASQNKFEKMVHNLEIKSRLMNQYADWKGVRYRFGGTSKRGIDCSAFVQTTFREQFTLYLPRSTYEQEDTGRSIQRAKLQPGDLVLFRAGSTGRHIGIYIDNDNFVHASTRSGVMISNLNDSYWKNRYRDARRVLNIIYKAKFS